MCCGCLLGCGKGMAMKFLMRNYTMNSYGEWAWVDGAPYLHSWKLNVIQEFACLLVQWHTLKIKTRKSHRRQVRSRSVYLTGGAVWGQECGPALLQEVGPLKYYWMWCPQVSSRLLRDPRPKDCMSAGVQDRQDNRAPFSPQACKCPGPYNQELCFLDMTDDLAARVKLHFGWIAKWQSF